MIDVSILDDMFDDKKDSNDKDFSLTSKKKKKKTKKKKNNIKMGYDVKKGYSLKPWILDWTIRDFTLYMNGYIRQQTGSVLCCCKFSGYAYQRLTIAMDKIVDEWGFCDNVIFKDYIDFFFQHYFLRLYTKYNNFKLAWIVNNNRIREFCKNYTKYNQNHKKARLQPFSSKSYYFPVKDIEKNISEEKEKTVEDESLDNNIQELYKVSEEIAIYNFGPILLYLYLIKEEKIEKRIAFNKIKRSCLKIFKQGNLFKIIEALKTYAPYNISDRDKYMISLISWLKEVVPQDKKELEQLFK